MRNYTFIFACLICILQLVLPVSADGINRNYQVEDGLSYNSVWCLCQDRKGYIWIGTKDGLNRFDGHTFRLYQKRMDNSRSLGNNFIHDLEEVSKERLLVGTNNGLYLYNRKYDNFELVKITGNHNREPIINQIKEDHTGNIWIATHGMGIFRLGQDLKVKDHFSSASKKSTLPSDYIWSLGIDNHNNLWIGTAGSGICLWNAHANSFISYNECGGVRLNGQSVYSILPDKDGSLWIGTAHSGLLHFRPAGNNVDVLLNDIPNIKAIKEYKKNQLIMGSEKGLVILDKHTGYQIPIPGMEKCEENYNAIFDVLCDRFGGIWTGTYFNGLNYLMIDGHSAARHVKIRDSKSARVVISRIIESPDSKILISTHNNNILYNYDFASNVVKPLAYLEKENVQDMMFFNGNLLVGTAGQGIDVLSYPDFSELSHIRHNLSERFSLYTLTNGDIIMAMEQGGAVYCPQNGKEMILAPLEGIHINGICQDHKGTIWFSTYNNGLFAWAQDGNWKNFINVRFEKETLFLSNLTSMAFCDNQLWIGSENMGILVYDIKKDQVVRCFDASNGLFSNVVYTIFKDRDGKIWTSTKNHVVSINPKDSKIRFVGRQDKSTPSNIHCGFESSDGKIYLGGTNGFYVIDTKRMSQSVDNGELVLTGLVVNAHEVLPGQEGSPLTESIENAKTLTINDSQNNFSIEFALLNYSCPEENLYRYRMEGIDKEWIYTKENSVNYMNLPAGTYVFHVSGSCGNGEWQKERVLEIVVKPPFLKSPFMIAMYVIILVLILGLGLWLYKVYIQNCQKERQKEFQIIHERETYEQKINFFTNIAHEIRTPLSLISGPLESILHMDNGMSEARHHLETIQRNTNRLLLLVNQLLDFRKIENDMFRLNIRYQKIDDIVMRVFEQYAPEADANGINIELRIDNKNLLGYIDAEALYKIVSNLLSNALKFCRKSIDIHIQDCDSHVRIVVTDDGDGIKSELQKKLFEPFFQADDENNMNRGTGLGLSLSRSLALKMNGQLTIDGTYTAGARFVLELPVMKDLLSVQSMSQVTRETVEKDKPCILVVEDNEDLADFISTTLSHNYNVLTAENGKIALDVINRNDVDIIISDVMMPVMDGLELCECLKASQEYSHLPIIILSAKTDTDTKIKGIKGGADVYLEKPFCVEQLCVQISTILKKREQLQAKIMASPLSYYSKTANKSDGNAEFVNKLNTIILDKMSDRDFCVDILVKEFATNRSDFQKKVKKVTGVTPNDYIKLIRLNKSAELLSNGKYRINEVCAIVGFNSPSYFSKCFHELFGKLPKDFINEESK